MTEALRQRYRELRFLVIDEHSASREALRTCVQAMGALHVDFSTGYGDAVARVRRSAPNVILCDYSLGDRRTGQHLLEELRRDDMLPEESVFIMVTAEKAYENVVATVELGPDDYIIKPFSPDRLKSRLDRALARKSFLRPLFVAQREGDFDAAGTFIEQQLKNPGSEHWRVDLLRQKTRLLLARNDLAGAQQVYREILLANPVPWARAGLARALMLQGRLREARALVDGVVDEAPVYFEAFDLKARICMEMGDHAEAQRTVEEASRRSTRNHARKRLLADVALRNGDAETARRAIADVLEANVSGEAPSVADRLMLVRSHLEAGDLPAAGKAMLALQPRDMERAGPDDLLSQQALLARLDAVAAEAFAGRCAACVRKDVSLSTAVDVVLSAFHVGDRDTAQTMTAVLFERGDIRPVFAQLRAAFAVHGLEQDFRDMQKRAALSRIGGAA